MKLGRLSSEASRLVTRELASGERLRHELAEYERYLDECPVEVELGAFDRAVDTAMAASRAFDPALDRLLAPLVHRTIALPRREAAQAGVWRFLTVIHRPDFVRHRWENRSWPTTRSRYWSLGTRPDSNVFARLWWIAELTVEDRRYTLTDQVLRRPGLATAIFVRGFCHYRPAVAAFVDVFADASAAMIDAGARRFNHLLSTVLLESLTVDDAREWLQQIRRQLASDHAS